MEVYYSLDSLPDLQRSAITIGSFDGIHIGHQKIIDRLINLSNEHSVPNVVITFDPHPRSIVYPKDNTLKLLSSLQEKIDLFEKYGVQHLVIVPFTIEFSQISAQEYIEKFLIENFKPSYIVVGYDHRFGLNRTGDFNLLKLNREKFGFEIIEITKQEIDEITISSTKIREALSKGDLESANTLLNHPYQVSGTVVRGRKLGTEIGFPTANIEVEESKKIIPKDGIYTCQVTYDTQTYNGMLYIGDIPTIGTDNKKSIEVNIFDFNLDIYDQRVSIHVLHYLRDDKKFESIEALRQQLQLDRKASLQFFDQSVQKKNKVEATIAILNYNTVSYLEEFLPSIGYSSTKEVDLVVIDNASSDESVDYLNEWHPEIRVISLSKNYGFAGGYNRGLTTIDTPYIVLLNSDVKVSENWLDPLVSYLNMNPEVAAVMPKIKSYSDQESFEYAGASGGFLDYLAYPFCRGRIFDSIEEDKGQYDSEEDIFWASGAACVVRTDVFRALAGFDTDYFAHQEEIDLCWRILRSGYKIKIIPTSVVYHLGGGSLDYSSPFKVYLNFRNNLYTLFKNDKAINLLWKLPLRFFLDMAASFKYLISGNLKASWAVLRAGFTFTTTIPTLIRKRKENNTLIDKIKLSTPTKSLLFQKSIVIQYYLFRNRLFSKIK
ncbi:bifunctional riboflavin kinase/FAD synthetase [Saprospiraceae bacterium]|nr:bifunctional riboflavin kinase/FAD synthetase [Saprospiraceae bacterium]